MKRALLILWTAGALGACSTLKNNCTQVEPTGYELCLVFQPQSTSLNAAADKSQPEIFYRTATLEEALAWQESLLDRGIVTVLRRKGGIAQ